MLMSSVEKVGEEGNEKIKLPFNVAQFHMESPDFHYYGLYVIQKDAYCIKVAEESGEDVQKTLTWDLNRYTALTDSENIAYVFFGNDTFNISLPPDNLGSITSLEIEGNGGPGYTITNKGNNVYMIKFLSNYYDDVDLELIINSDTTSIKRNLNIRRVGMHIEKYAHKDYDPNDPWQAQVAHGTQFSSEIDYSGGKPYHIYGTFYIPDGGTVAPRLYVTYTRKNGDIETELVDVLENPADNKNAERYENGVFFYGEDGSMAPACDYLLYAGSEADAPVEINVIVLKGDHEAGENFAGVTFGSGRGVTWKK